MRIQRALRNTQGAGLLLGIAALGLLIAITIGGTLFLTNAGLSLYFKDKLAFVTSQAAQALQSDLTDAKLGEKAEAIINGLLTSMDLPKAATIAIDPNVEVNGQPVLFVTVTDNFQLLGDGKLLPNIVKIQDTQLADPNIESQSEENQTTKIIGAAVPLGDLAMPIVNPAGSKAINRFVVLANPDLPINSVTGAKPTAGTSGPNSFIDAFTISATRK